MAVARVDMGTVRGVAHVGDVSGVAGLTFCMWPAMPGYIIVPPDSMSFQYRSCQMSKSHLEIKLYLCAVCRGAWAPAMQRYARRLIDAEASRPRKGGWKSAMGV